MREDAHLIVTKDRNGRFSGYYRCSLCQAEFRPNPKNLGEMAIFFAAHARLSHPPKDPMDSLEVLKTLLTMTTEAEKLATDTVRTERLSSLIGEIRCKARKECGRLKHDLRQIGTRYQLCMVGIGEECFFGRAPLPNVTGLEARLKRIREEIDGTMKEIEGSRRIMSSLMVQLGVPKA